MGTLRGGVATAELAMLVLLLATTCQATSMATTHFDEFFPFWNVLLQETLRYNCSSELATYKTGEREPGTKYSSLITPVIDCILQNMPEHRKAELGASAVVLGLLPTILSTLGSTPAETAFLHLRRPVLAMLLALGSPSVAVMKTSDYKSFTANLVEQVGARPSASTSSSRGAWTQPVLRNRVLLSITQYVLAMGAAGNVVYMCYQLGYHAIVSWTPETIFMVPLWTFICIVLHFGAVWIQSLRISVASIGPANTTNTATPIFRSSSNLIRKLPQEHVPIAFQRHKTIRWRGDTAFVNLLIWALCIGAVVNLIFGSMISSSILFFSVKDVLVIATRYILSTLVCRGIGRLELLGARESRQRLKGSERLSVAIQNYPGPPRVGPRPPPAGLPIGILRCRS
ncbi:hypothetical protein Micbo1qcDRAFT_181927 [Microdochium bolleyi]|uniref:Uncharacterized protein n=1 Tax=Microdochium bolleyi TaxID=196109 RepID=A0A136JKH9_9PEZI|nr:hypothetical protein Micbo1qcDRAFT_181927 [Microdochium bolleyi]